MQQDQQTPCLLGKQALSMEQQAWKQFEHSGAITDYLRYKEAIALSSSSQGGRERHDAHQNQSNCAQDPSHGRA